MTPSKRIVLLITLTATTALLANSRLDEDFADGDLTGGTLWKPLKQSSPWQLADKGMRPGGTTIFDSISTDDFKPVEDGVFDLEFSVRFHSDAPGGNNRFSVFLRDKTNRSAGYGATVSQATGNNANLVKLTADGKQVELGRMKPSAAYRFPTDRAIPVRFTRDAAGNLKLYIDGKVVMEGVDPEWKRFDRLQFTSRCATAEQIHSFGPIRLK